MLKVYVISGCCGSGKTTLTKELIKVLPKTALVEGDALEKFLYHYPVWEERLKLVWQNILLVTDNYLRNGFNVIIDYIVEDELPQVISAIKKYDVELRYIVLTADEDTIKQRLIHRGDDWLVERGLFLLQQLTNCEHNRPYLYDGTKSTLEEQVNAVKNFMTYVY